MAAYMYVRSTAQAGFAKKLARRLGIRCVDSNLMPRFRANNGLICWGNSTPPAWRRPRGHFWLANTPEHVAVASHKTRTLQALSTAGVPTLEYTTNRQTALEWFRNGAGVYARTSLQGHSGEGLVFLDPQSINEQGFIQAPLYTKDFGTPFKEYRVHVAFGNVIDITQKKRLSEEELLARNMDVPEHRERLQVRTYGNGWVFTRQNIRDHESIRELALSTARALNNMPVAVVDIAAEWRGGAPVRSAVIEVNTAPALRSDTLLNAYVEAFRPHITRTTPVPIPEVAPAVEPEVVEQVLEPQVRREPVQPPPPPVPEPEPAPIIRQRPVDRMEYMADGRVHVWLSDTEYVEVRLRA